jgi:hypothetical protein
MGALQSNEGADRASAAAPGAMDPRRRHLWLTLAVPGCALCANPVNTSNHICLHSAHRAAHAIARGVMFDRQSDA